MKKALSILLTIAILSNIAMAQRYPFENTKLPVDQRVEDLIGRLTLDEKLGFLMHANQPVDRLGIKPYSWWNEALHGVARNGTAVVYPMPIAMAASFNPALVRNVYRDIAYEGIHKHQQMLKENRYDEYCGLTFFTPNINIFRDPRWGRGMETFGEDPYLTSLMGLSAVEGLQGNDPNHLLTAACLKHFAVHSGPEGLRHEWNSEVSSRDLWTTYLAAFSYIIHNSDVQQVMCGYNRINGAPCCANTLLSDILRNRWGYDGILVTDCWAINDMWERDTVIPRHKTHATAALAEGASFGSEVDLECGSGLPALKVAVDSGYLPESKIDEHLRRVLKTRMTVELNDTADMRYEGPHAGVLEDISRQSMVLLKNNHMVPLRYYHSDYKKLAVIGPNAADSSMQWGNYNGFPAKTTTIKMGFEQLLGESQIYFDTACHHVKNDYQLPKQFWDNLNTCDAIVFCGGISPALEGEELPVEVSGFHRGDRTNIELPEVQRNLIHQIRQKTNKPIILVLCTGSSIALEDVEADADAILVSWYGGEIMGTTVADVVNNNARKLGRLPLTFYRNTKQMPDFGNYSMKGRTYRYMTEEPLYPFGFGLSECQYQLSNLRYDDASRTVKGYLREIGDIEDYSEDEAVVEVYARNLSDTNAPKLTLVGFERIPLGHGLGREFQIKISKEAFFNYSEEEETMKDMGDKFELLVGFSSSKKDLTRVKVERY